MYESFFTYNLTRPYPYKWFTWAVGLGGLAFTVFFSIVNLAANGYALNPVYTTDPNGTLSETHWFQKPPWTLTDNIEASCQSQNLALNTQLFTTQLGFTYSLSNVWSYAPDGSTIVLPSLTYLNNTLEDCSVNNIFINAINSNTLGNSPGWAWQTSPISAVATCSAYNGASRYFFNMTVQYQSATSTDTAHNARFTTGAALLNTGFLDLNQKSKACLWWGQELLLMWFWNLASSLAPSDGGNNVTDANTISNARLYMIPSGSKNITNLDFLNITGWFYMGNGDLHPLQTSGVGDQNLSPMLADVDVGIAVHRFATVFYSTILSDLGQPAGPNILTDFDLIRQYVLEGYALSPLYGVNPSLTAQQAFDQVKTSSGPLSISPSTFYSQYLCQVPRLRSVGPVIIAVLVADVVFLQALFSILTLTTTWYLNRTDKQSNFCEGCEKRVAGKSQEQAEETALLSLSPKQSRAAKYEGRKMPDVDVSSQPVTPNCSDASAFFPSRQPMLTSRCASI